MILSFITEEITGMLDAAAVNRLNSRKKMELLEQENPWLNAKSPENKNSESIKQDGVMNNNSHNTDKPVNENIEEKISTGPVFRQNNSPVENPKEEPVNGDGSFEKKYKLLLEQMQKERNDRELLLNKYNDLIFKRSDN